jgi:AcrR family transcriptional regulator
MTKPKDTTTENSILEAAKSVFQRKGMAGARMQEIADKAGINKALLHYYFRSKQLLFNMVFKQAFKMMSKKIAVILNVEEDLEVKINKFTYEYISFVIKHPYLPSFVLQELNGNPNFLQKMSDSEAIPSFSAFKNQVESLIKQNKIRAIDPNQLIINIMALSVFPFVGKPLLKTFTNLNEEDYQLLLEERKTEVANFIINAIKIE